MLQLLNEARTNPTAAAEMLTTDLTPDVQATLQYYNVNIQATAQKIASATPQPPAGLECRSGRVRPEPKPVPGE